MEGKNVHIALPDSLTLEILFYADLLDVAGLAVVEPADRLLELGDRNLLHWP